MDTKDNSKPERTATDDLAAVQMAEDLYGAFGAAGFTRSTITDLAVSVNGKVKWPKLDKKLQAIMVRTCMLIQDMSVDRYRRAAEKAKEVTKTIAPAEQPAPAPAQDKA